MDWTLPVKKPKNWQQTKKDDINVAQCSHLDAGDGCGMK